MMVSFLKRYIVPLLVSVGLVVAIDLLTNTVTKELLFDSKIYIGMAEHGLTRDRISPFAYRFAGPFLAGEIQRSTDRTMYESFKLLTYAGAVSQLFLVFLLVRQLARSEKSAYVGMLVVAFSLFNIKYPLFDVYRPDILAYPIILIGTWFALKDRFFLLLLTTMAGLQFREFTIVPLIAYLAVKIQHYPRKEWIDKAVLSILAMLAAIAIPRLLIPVQGHHDAVELSRNGFEQALDILVMWPRNLNIVFIVLAYFLPALILYSAPRLRAGLEEVPAEIVHYFIHYSWAVLLLLILGGTDLGRFASYFFLPLALLTGFLVKDHSSFKILLVLMIQFVFNRIWLPFPVQDVMALTNFYSGWYDVINTASIWRFAELAVWMILGRILVHARLFSRQEVLAGSK